MYSEHIVNVKLAVAVLLFTVSSSNIISTSKILQEQVKSKNIFLILRTKNYYFLITLGKADKISH